MKPFWTSKLFWLGAVQIGIGLPSVVQDWLGTETDIAVLLNGFAIVILRWFTAQPITSITPALDKFRPGVMSQVQGDLKRELEK